MRYVICLAVLLSVTGCAQYEAYRAVGIKGAEMAADRVLEDTNLASCQLPTLGSLRRAYGDDLSAPGWRLRMAFCSGVALNIPEEVMEGGQ